MDVALLSLAAGLAVADTLTGLGVGAVELKWPNDVLVAGRKISGVLAEASFRDGDPEWVVLGIGVNLKVEAVPLDLTDRATSLDQEAVPIDAKSLMVQLLTALGLWYGRLEVQGPASVVDAWIARAPMAKGRTVSVANGDDRFEATTDGVSPHGALRVRLPDGQTRELSSGEVTLSAVADGK
jgi:BirA family biotin operon repressor/biotin-[acetyl-CoA-carboxylase] ligase